MLKSTATSDLLPSASAPTLSPDAPAEGNQSRQRLGRLRRQWWLMPLCGLVLALSAPGFGLWPLAWLALIPALIWVRAQHSQKAVFTGGFWLGFAYHGLFCLWFFDLHPLTWLGFTEMGSRLITLAGWLLIATEGGLLGGLLMLGYHALKPGWVRLLVFPMLWVAGFALLNVTPMALPWALLEVTQAPLWPMRALMGVIGGSGVTTLLVVHNALWAEGWIKGRRWALALIAPVAIGLIAALPGPPGMPPLMPVALVDAALPIDVVRNASQHEALIEQTYIAPVVRTDLPPGTLVIYPEEGIVPGWVLMAAPGQNPAFAALQAIARQKRLWIAVGVSALEPQPDAPGRMYNAIALLGPDATPVQFYRKRRLVPFGEFTPYGMGDGLSRLLARWDVNYSAPFASGPNDPAPLLHAGKAKLGGLVCFEMIDAMPGFWGFGGGFSARHQRQGANMLVNASNLGWFHDNPLLEAQFMAIAQVRAAETSLPVVIASNTGHSAVIAGGGRILLQTRPTGDGSRQSHVVWYASSH